jgi:hypothetical protein
MLEKIIADSGLKKSYIAKTIGITGYSLTKKIRNENEFKATEINALCNLLKIDSLELKDEIFFAFKVD